MPPSRLRFGAGERGVPGAVFPDDEALGEALAGEILEEVERAREQRRSYLMRCDWPASFIYRCQNPSILVDRFASPAA